MQRTALTLLVALIAVSSGHTTARAGEERDGSPLTTGDKIGKDCMRKGKKLFGKVKVVQNFPDLKVKAVQNFPDLKVKMVEHFPDACGKWQMVENFPDFTIQYVEHFPDLEIQMVEHFPGVP